MGRKIAPIELDGSTSLGLFIAHTCKLKANIEVKFEVSFFILLCAYSI